jgi:hypothetical protein
MGKCIEELYDEMQGKIVSEICENDKINNLWNELNKLKSSIGKEEYKIFDEYLYNEVGLIDVERKQAFVYGYKLENRLMVDSFRQ